MTGNNNGLYVKDLQSLSNILKLYTWNLPLVLVMVKRREEEYTETITKKSQGGATTTVTKTLHITILVIQQEAAVAESFAAEDTAAITQ
jgi:hypothetical protein